MDPSKLIEIDKSLEIATLVLAGEAGFARDHKIGHAFGAEGDMRRLDAFTLGMLDALAHRTGERDQALPMLTYLHKLEQHGPGIATRHSFREMLALIEIPKFAAYVAGGRRHIIRVLSGKAGDPGEFARLLTEELTNY